MIKTQGLKLKSRLHRQRGLSLLELMISTALLMLIMVMGTTIFTNIQSHLKIAEDESRMQQHARDAMTKMARELRQTVGVVESPGSPSYPTDIYFVVPHVNADGTSSTFNQVRYWFAEDYDKPGSNIRSLYRAVKNIGTSSANSTTAFTNNRTRLIREAAAQSPGTDSYFELKNTTPGQQRVYIKIRVAIYRSNPDNPYQYSVKKNFDLDTEVLYRNQS